MNAIGGRAFIVEVLLIYFGVNRLELIWVDGVGGGIIRVGINGGGYL